MMTWISVVLSVALVASWISLLILARKVDDERAVVSLTIEALSDSESEVQTLGLFLQAELQRHYELESRWVRMEGFEEWAANRNQEMREQFSVPNGTTLAHETPQETWDTIIDSAIRNTKSAPRHATPTDNAFRRLITALTERN